jgi:DNA polymerase III subunit delta
LWSAECGWRSEWSIASPQSTIHGPQSLRNPPSAFRSQSAIRNPQAAIRAAAVPTLAPTAVRGQIAAGTPDPVYLLLGEDDIDKTALASEFAELVDEELRAFNVERIHAGDWTSGDKLLDGVGGIVAAARTLPMMAARRVVIVLQAETLLAPKRESDAADRAAEQLAALLDRPEPLTTLVLVPRAIDRRSRIYKQLQKSATIVEIGVPDDLAGAERWVRNRVAQTGVEIEPAAARHMAVLAGFPDRPQRDKTGNLKRLRSDVDRVLLYALGQKRITVDDARAVAGPALLQDQWAIANAIESGDAAKALRQLALALEAGAVPEMMLGQLAWLVRSKFPAIAPAEVVPAVDALFRTDEALKSSGGDRRILLERLVVELCAGRRTASRRW